MKKHQGWSQIKWFLFALLKSFADHQKLEQRIDKDFQQFKKSQITGIHCYSFNFLNIHLKLTSINWLTYLKGLRIPFTIPFYFEKMFVYWTDFPKLPPKNELAFTLNCIYIAKFDSMFFFGCRRKVFVILFKYEIYFG